MILMITYLCVCTGYISYYSVIGEIDIKHEDKYNVQYCDNKCIHTFYFRFFS